MDQTLPRKASDIVLTLACARPLGAGEPAGLEQWEATAAVPGTGDEGMPVGTVSVLALDLVACEDPWGALDGSNDDIAHIGDTVFDEMTGQLSESLNSRLAGGGTRVLVIDRVELEPEWQGRNVAALLVAETVHRMRAGVRAALCLPAPLHRAGESKEEYDESLRRVQQVWSQAGFTLFKDGVWLLEPHRGALDASLHALREQHGLA